MKSFSCGAVVPGCVAVFEGPSDEDILSQVARHALDDHGLAEVPSELVTKVRANIQVVGA